MKQLLSMLQEMHAVFYERNFAELDSDDVCDEFAEITGANVCIVTPQSKLKYVNGGIADPKTLQEKLLAFRSGISGYVQNLRECELNIQIEQPFCLLEDNCTEGYFSFLPIFCEGSYQGALIIWSKDCQPLCDRILIVGESTRAMISLAMARSRNREDSREKMLQEAAAVAVGILSFSELRAVKELVDILKEDEGTLIISELAESIYITRSVISGALRKLESSEMIIVHSLGVKGTYIKICNPYLRDCVHKVDGARVGPRNDNFKL